MLAVRLREENVQNYSVERLGHIFRNPIGKQLPLMGIALVEEKKLPFALREGTIQLRF